MPQSKSVKRRQRRNRKGGKKVPTNKTLAKRLKKMEFAEELKHTDTVLQNTNITATSGTYMDSLCQITLGTSSIGRIGNQIQTTSVQMRGQIRILNTALLTSTVRMILYWDKQCNGAVNTIGQLLDTGATNFCFAAREYANIDRFDILWDKTIVLTPYHATDTTHVLPVAMNFNKVFKTNRIVKYGANAGAITDLRGNRLVMMFVADGDITGFNSEVEFWYVRLYYKDV